MPVGSVALMVAVGLAYTIGAVVLFRGRPDPWPTRFGYHEVWHACTVAASGCHFAMICLVVASTDACPCTSRCGARQPGSCARTLPAPSRLEKIRPSVRPLRAITGRAALGPVRCWR